MKLVDHQPDVISGNSNNEMLLHTQYYLNFLTKLPLDYVHESNIINVNKFYV
jgi:hypothetical protein